MKALLSTAVLLAGLSVTAAHAQPPHAKAWGKRNKMYVQPARISYIYYPSVNMYFSPVSHRYWYPRNGVWVSVNTLPAGIVIGRNPGYTVYCDDWYEIWRDNPIHRRRYMVVQPAPRPGVSVNINARF